MGAARDVTPDILVQLAEAERVLDALAARAAEEGFLLVMEHTHDLPEPMPDWHPGIRWTPYLERRVYAPPTTAPVLTTV